MNCKQVQLTLDDYLDACLDQDDMRAVSMHVGDCAQCHAQLAKERRLRAALHALAVPEPSDDFFDRALSRARQQAKQNRKHRWVLMTGGALAASLALVFAVRLFVPSVPGVLDRAAISSQQMAQQTQNIPGLSIALGEVRNVSLAINSAMTLNHVQFSIDLPPGVELNGFPKQRFVHWQGRLKKGKNLLELPVIARNTHGGIIKARIEHGGKQTIYRLNMEVSLSHAPSVSQQAI